MSADGLDLREFLYPGSALPQLQWDLVRSRVKEQTDEREQHDFSTGFTRQWVQLMRDALGDPYVVSESDNFVLLGPETRVSNFAMLRAAEHRRESLLNLLPDLAEFHSFGKLPVIVLYGDVAYYAHVSHYQPEGEFGRSGGMNVRGDWPHVVLVDAEPTTLHRSLAHELTHAALMHLTLPLWVEEGLAQLSEHDVTGETANFDVKKVRRQKEHWRSLGLELFWSGKGFFCSDASQEFSYILAEILMRLLLEDFRPRWFGLDQRPLEHLIAFLRAAQAEDAGQAAAKEHLGKSLGQLAAQSLGAGSWEPHGGYSHVPLPS
jgi:hypothetical protein